MIQNTTCLKSLQPVSHTNSASLPWCLVYVPGEKLFSQLVSGDYENAHAFGKSNTYEVVVALQRHFEFTNLILQEIF